MPPYSPYLPNSRLRLYDLRWDRTCPFCGIQLLSGENAGFCCGPQGKYFNAVPPLPRLPDEFYTFLNDPQVSGLSRKLNLLFSFAALQTTAAFPNTADGFLAIQGEFSLF